jgi:hypothetical protein
MKGSRNADCFLLGLHDQTMNALVLHGIGDLRHEQKPTPAPQAGGLVTHDVPLSEGVGALEMMRDQSAFFSKVMLRPDATPGPQET